MKLIKPAEISAKIMTLIDEAEKELFIISPYNNIVGWNKLINRIKKAQSKGVSISWYSRKKNVTDNNDKQIKNILGIDLILVDNLHAKIYMNEEYAIISSMNISKVSDENSIDIGYRTETETEYEEIHKVFTKYIKEKINVESKKDNALGLKNKKLTISQILENIQSDYPYINIIHEHILKKYGSFKFNYRKDTILEYLDFKNLGYKIQFIPYTRAIKILVCLPPTTLIKNFEQFIFQNKKAQELIKNNELECYETDSEQYIKYYYQLRYKNVYEWNNSDLEKLLKDLGILIEIVFSKV